MASLRTKKTEKTYRQYRKQFSTKNKECDLCTKEPLFLFTYWKIIENSFPYDLIAKKHNMIVPIRHCCEEELTKKECKEFLELKKKFIHNDYDYLLESSARLKTIPEHFHIHLLTLRNNKPKSIDK